MKEEINKKKKILGFSLKTLKTKVFCLYRQRRNNGVKKQENKNDFRLLFKISFGRFFVNFPSS